MSVLVARIAAAAVLAATVSACSGGSSEQAWTPAAAGRTAAPTTSGASTPRPAQVGETQTVVHEGHPVRITVVRTATIPGDEAAVPDHGRWLGIQVAVTAEGGPLELHPDDFAVVDRDGARYAPTVGPKAVEQVLGVSLLTGGTLNALKERGDEPVFDEVWGGAVVFDVPSDPGAVTRLVYAPAGRALASWTL